MAEAKIPKAADASKHKAGGGNVEICQTASWAPHTADCACSPRPRYILIRLSLPDTGLLSGSQAGLEG